MHNHSYENESNLHVNYLLFSHERMNTMKEAKGNSQMAQFSSECLTSGFIRNQVNAVKGNLGNGFSLVSVATCAYTGQSLTIGEENFNAGRCMASGDKCNFGKRLQTSSQNVPAI